MNSRVAKMLRKVANKQATGDSGKMNRDRIYENLKRKWAGTPANQRPALKRRLSGK